MLFRSTHAVETSTEMSLEKDKDSGKDSTAIKSTTSMDLTQNILGDLKLDYDVVEDLKKMKYNIIVFKLCKIAQLREQLHRALQQIQGSHDMSVGNTKVTLKGKLQRFITQHNPQVFQTHKVSNIKLRQ